MKKQYVLNQDEMNVIRGYISMALDEPHIISDTHEAKILAEILDIHEYRKERKICTDFIESIESNRPR